MTFIRPTAVRKAVRRAGKRCGRDFLEALDRRVDAILSRAIQEHNGGRKTLDADVLNWVAGKR